MPSLKDMYNVLVEADQEKYAAAQVAAEYGEEFVGVDEGLLKQAEDYDTVGRVLAHNVFTDLVKEAMEEEMPEASDEEKKKKLLEMMAKARGEAPPEGAKKDEEKGDEAEKKAHVAGLVLERMSQDPEYVSALISKYYGG